MWSNFLYVLIILHSLLMLVAQFYSALYTFAVSDSMLNLFDFFDFPCSNGT